MTVRILSPLEKDEIVALYKKGESKAVMAFDYSVSRKTIARVLIEAGVYSPEWRSEIHVTAKEAKLITEMRKQHIKPEDMVNGQNLSVIEVFKWFRNIESDRQNLILKLMAAEIQRNKKVA